MRSNFFSGPLDADDIKRESLCQRAEPGFRYYVEVVDDPNRANQERLALVEYCEKIWINNTLPPPKRVLLFCDNRDDNRQLMQKRADELNKDGIRFEAHLRGVLSSDADRNDNEAAKQKGKVRE